MSAACWKYELTVPGPAASAFAEALAPLADAVSLLDMARPDGWRVLAYGVGVPPVVIGVRLVAGEGSDVAWLEVEALAGHDDREAPALAAQVFVSARPVRHTDDPRLRFQ